MLSELSGRRCTKRTDSGACVADGNETTPTEVDALMKCKGKEKGKGKGKDKGKAKSKDKPKEGTPDKSSMK